MPAEALRRPPRLPARAAVATTTPPRLRPKGPVGPDFYRQCPAAEVRPRQSAVERLEADKAKYVKSQVALSKQQPLRPPAARKPLLTPSAVLLPTRKNPTQTKVRQEGVQLDVEHLTNLISGVSAVSSKVDDRGDAETAAPAPAETQSKPENPCPPARPDWSSSAKVRLKASGPVQVESSVSAGSPAAGTVRRVDVMPQAGAVRTACRPAQFMRQPLQPIPLHSQFALRSAASHLRLFHPRTTPGSTPLKPMVVVPPKLDKPLAAAMSPAPLCHTLPLPPPSPAITRRSSSSSRKRPSLTRSKSDTSDRYSRAGTEMERFFNLCGLDPAELQELAETRSDIVSMARFRSVSAPGSECPGSAREDEEDDDGGDAAARVPYGVSVIERNARVIKWLYGLRQAKDCGNKSTNL